MAKPNDTCIVAFKSLPNYYLKLYNLAFLIVCVIKTSPNDQRTDEFRIRLMSPFKEKLKTY